MKKRYSLIIILNLLVFNLFAYHSIVQNFTKKTSKSGSQNWDITQDESNVMYFANNLGLLEFDGKNWTTYPMSNNTNVRSVLSSPTDKRVYVGAFNEFGYFERIRNGQMKYVSLANKLKNPNHSFNEVWHIQKDDKSVYFQSEKSIFKYTDNAVTDINFGDKIDASALINGVYIIASGKKGAFMLNGEMFVKLPGSEMLLNTKICSILPFDGNKVLFVTSFNGVYLFDGLSFKPYDTGVDSFLRSSQVFCANTNGKSIVYGTVQNGIVVQSVTDKSIMYVNTYSGLQNNTVLSVSFDNLQNIWLGLDKGIDYVLLNSPIKNIFGTNNLYGAGYASVLMNNMLYLGTNQGLYTSDYPFQNTFTPIQPKIVDAVKGQVWCLEEIDNTLFCGSDGGAFIVKPSDVERIPGLQGTWMFKKLQHHPDMILGCSYQGLFIMKKINGSWQFSHFLKGNFNESSRLFEEGRKDEIWFSHWQKGLFRLRFNSEMDSIVKVDLYGVEKGFPTNRNNTVYRIDDKLVFSSEYGFFNYNEKTDKMEPYAQWNNCFVVPPNSVRLNESKNKDTWFLSGDYFGMISKNEKKTDSITYQPLIGKLILGFENFNNISDDQILLGTEDGFSLLDLKNNIPIKDALKVFIRNITVTSGSDSLIAGHITVDQKSGMEIPYSQNSLRFEFIAPEYRDQSAIQYSYMLENYDKEWSTFSSSNIKEYTKLPNGNYVFRVKAKSRYSDTVTECSYHFTILPAWYQSNLAIVIYALLVILGIAVLFYFIDKHSKKKVRAIEQTKEAEMRRQEELFEASVSEKEEKIIELENEQLEYKLHHKSQELATSTMNLIRKNEILLDLKNDLSKICLDVKAQKDVNLTLIKLNKMQMQIKENIESDDNWKRFEENFDFVYDNFLKKLSKLYPDLTMHDKKLCAYIKMGLFSKEIAPILNMSIRSVEMSRYRLRKKMNLDRDINLVEYLQKL